MVGDLDRHSSSVDSNPRWCDLVCTNLACKTRVVVEKGWTEEGTVGLKFPEEKLL